MVRRAPDVVRFGLWTIVGVAIVTVPVFFAGRKAVDVVGNVPGVIVPNIEEHEEAGEWALGVVSAGGIASAVVLLVSRKSPAPSRRLTIGMIVVATVLLAVVVRTSLLGGHIHHPETGGGEAQLQLPAVEPQK